MNRNNLNQTLICHQAKNCEISAPANFDVIFEHPEQIYTLSWTLSNESDEDLEFIPLILNEDLRNTLNLVPKLVPAHQTETITWQFSWPDSWLDLTQSQELNFDYVWIMQAPRVIYEEVGGDTYNIYNNYENHYHQLEEMINAASNQDNSSTSHYNISHALDSEQLTKLIAAATANSQTQTNDNSSFDSGGTHEVDLSPEFDISSPEPVLILPATSLEVVTSTQAGQVLGAQTQENNAALKLFSPLWWLGIFWLLLIVLLLIALIIKKYKKNQKD